MDSSSYRGKKKFSSRKDIPTKTVINERYDEEWNEYSSQEEFEFENNKLPLESIPEPEYDEEEVLLSWYDSDLNLVIDENFTAASPLQQKGFSYLQAGARATFGFFCGKVCFEVKVLQCGKLSSRQGHLNTHLLRVGWSPRKSSLALGSDHKSYGYDSAGRISTIGEIVDYGKPFSTGDVVGAFMDAGEDEVTLSFTLNGEDMGVAYQIPQSVIQKEPLFPHILTKNISYECNFGREKSWFPPKDGYTFVADVSKVSRIAGPRRPKSQSECEVILMVGLPKSGKTTWVNEFREKHPGMYYVIDPHNLVDRMELMDPERRSIILSRTKLLGKLLGIAMDRRRNYILDQVNVGWEEQVWKLGYFRNHKRRIVAIVIPDEELRKRTRKLDDNDLDWMYILKAKFRLPIMACRQIAEVTNTVEYVGLPLSKALPLVKFYNREAWRLGYKNKKFWIPSAMFKEKKKITEGDWMSPEMNVPREADFRGSGGWSSPPRERGKEEWFPPPRNRSGEEWQSPPRTRDSGEWRSPSRQRMNEDWPPSRRRSPGMWPPPEHDRLGGLSPSRGQTDEGWPPDSRKRRYSESPPRRRPGTRWGPPVEECSHPQGREEEWQLQRARSPGPRNSPPRRRPDAAARYPGRLSPPRMRTEEMEFGRNRVRAEDPTDWKPDRGGRPMQGNPNHEDWIGTGPERAGRFPMQETRDRSGGFPHDMPLEGNFPPDRRGDSGMLPHGSRGSSNLPPEEVDFGGRFSHRGGMVHGRSRSPPLRRMDNEFPYEEDRFGSKMSRSKERVDDVILSREVRIDADFLPQDQRMGGTFPHKDRGFHDVQFETERVVFEERGNMPPLDGKMVRGLSPHSRKGNDFPTPERRMGGLSVRERLGAKLDDMPPRGGRPSRSLSPRERMMGNMLPDEGRMPCDATLFEPEMRDFPPHEGRFNEIPPHMGKIRDDRMGPIGRSGGNMYPHENRRDDARSVRMIGNIPPQEHRMGDLPSHEDRMSGDFSHREGRSGDLPPLRSRRADDFGPEVTDYQFPQHEQPGINLLHHESRMGSDVLPREIRSADFPFQEGRIGRGDSRREREIVDIPRGGRMSGDMPIAMEGGVEITSHRGRLVGEGPPGGNRSSGSDLPRGRKGEEFPPSSGRIDADLPLRGRGSGGEFLHRGGKIMGDLPPMDRMGSDRMAHRERIGGDMEPHGGRHGDLPPLEGRHGGDMPMPEGKSFSDLPVFGGRHDEFLSHGGRPGNDKAHHGRPGDDLPSGGRMYGGDFTSHGGRIGDMPPSGRRIGGDKVQEAGMLDDRPCETRGSSSEHWNRLPADREDPRGFEWMGTQDVDPNKRNVKNRPGSTGQLHPHTRSEGGGPPGDWKPIDDRMPDRPSQPMQELHRLDNRDNDNNINCFRDKRGSPSRAPRKWPSPNRTRRPVSRSPNRPRRQSLSPVRRSRFDDQGFRQNVEQPGGRHISPRRPVGGRQSPLGRSDRRSPEGRHASRQQSPVRGGGGGSWRPPGDRHGEEWPRVERGNRSGPSDRLPPNIDRGHHSPPRKQQRLETDPGDRPNRPFAESLDGRDQQGPGFQMIGNIDKKHEPAERDLRDRMSGPEPLSTHSAPFIPSGPSGSSGSAGMFLGKEDAAKEPAGGWPNVHGPPHKGWPSSGSGGGGSRWERVPEEEEELAPYEIPFNQADWDSNDPNAGIYNSASNYREHQMSSVVPGDERNKESSGSRNPEVRGHPDSKGRGSVWQRVGGYVDDEKESSKRGSRGSSRYTDHSSRSERGHRGGERGNKDRERDFEASRVRRGRDK